MGMPTMLEILIIISIATLFSILSGFLVVILNIYTSLGTKYSRLKYANWSLAMILLSILIPLVLDNYEQTLLGVGNKTNPVIFFILIMPHYVWLNALTNRIRDYGSNPWIALWATIPIIDILIGIYFGFAKQKSKNELSDNKTITEDINNHHQNIKSNIYENPKIEPNNQQSTIKNDNDIIEELNEDEIYEKVMIEIEEDNKVKSTWAKAFAQSNGDEKKAQALYINLRVQTIVNDIKIDNIKKKKELLKKQDIENSYKEKSQHNQKYDEYISKQKLSAVFFLGFLTFFALLMIFNSL